MWGFGKGVGQITETEAEKLARLERERLHAGKQEQLHRKALEEVKEGYAFPKEVPEVGQRVNLISYNPKSQKDQIVCLEGSVSSRKNCKNEGHVLLRITSRPTVYEVVYIVSTGMWWDYAEMDARGSRKEAIVTVVG